MTYLPVIDLLKAYFAIQDRDDPRDIREKVTGKLLALDPALSRRCRRSSPCSTCPWTTRRGGPSTRRSVASGPSTPCRRLLLRESPRAAAAPDLRGSPLDRQRDAGAARRPGREPGIGAPAAARELSPRVPARVGQQDELQPAPARCAARRARRRVSRCAPREDPGLAPLKQLLVKRGNPFFLEETRPDAGGDAGAGRASGAGIG